MYKKIMRVAASFLIAITFLFGVTMAVSPTARAAVVNFVRTWFEDRTIYHVPPQNLNRDWSFGYIPDGFELVEEINDEHQKIFIWEDENLLPIYIIITTGDATIDNEHYNFYTITINGNIADVYESIDDEYPSMIAIHDKQNGVIIILWAYLDVNEVIKIAENIE